MTAGGKGDEPYLDIVAYGLTVFSEKADNLIREMSVLMEYSEFLNFREELQQIKESNAFTIDVLEQRLEQRKKALLSRASEHGWDVQRLEDEMRARKAVSSVGKQPAT